ncbi:metal-sensitive transcriptional regulator [Microcoleus sp. FACHB-68]|uniref:metal-sensing transcriptional repressor n=1 Tax=Microcoleus sp. FACHB-68 TaxID=2692826 RepID=UPI00168597CC|nr:metal-sensitive transcriptional regulator [Microcoleus sp. FACHB-68]MBD1938971.1 metal-sensitive transcriptional regulator [Microcoleus sp. FACHB-68]
MIGTNSLTDKTLSLAGKDELGRLQEKDDLYSAHTHGDGHTAHHHVHTEESLRRLVNRLSRIEGHIRGIKTMVQESKPCPDVLVQVAAVRGALDRVARIILDEHLTECIARAAKEGNIDDEIEELKAALDRFLPREKKKDSGTKN